MLSTFTVQCTRPVASTSGNAQCAHLMTPSHCQVACPALPCPVLGILSSHGNHHSLFLFLNLSTLSAWYMWTLYCVHAHVCVCVRDRETERASSADYHEGSYHVSVSFLFKDKWYCSVCCMYIVCILLPTHPAMGTSVVPTLELLTML